MTINDKPAATELALGALVECPMCGVPAEISDCFTLGGAPEPVEHVKIVCVARHSYTLPVDMFPVSGRVSEDTSASGITARR